jgi:glycerol-3-phosphate acyltransferase PlsX
VEGTALFLAGEMKKMFKKNTLTKLSALMVSGGIKDFKKLLDSREIGGTALLGISKPVIKAHGSSDGYAIKNAIAQAAKFASSGIIEDITANVDYMKIPVNQKETEKI